MYPTEFLRLWYIASFHWYIYIYVFFWCSLEHY
jgi:hypothetical protein